MSDGDDLNLDGEDAAGSGTPKKPSGLAALLPNLLKFVAIGLGALIFIVTVSVITYNILIKGGQSQPKIPLALDVIGNRPQYQMFTSIGMIRTSTKDPLPYSVVVDMAIGYDLNDNTTQAELTGRLYELRDFVRVFFKGKMADDLKPESEPSLKQEILEQLNTKILSSGRARIILFTQLDVMAMQ
jgi:flagellar protein FliL